MRPWASTVITGILVLDPYVAAAVAPATLDRYSADPRKAFAEMFPVALRVVEAPSVTKRLEPTTKVLKGLVFETPTFEKLVVRAGDAYTSPVTGLYERPWLDAWATFRTGNTLNVDGVWINLSVPVALSKME
jgi:hypothetical protein